MNYLLFIYYILIITTSFCGLYFVLTIVPSLFNKKDIIFNENEVKHRFAILIPARNEENVVGNLIASLQKQNYPNDKYDIYVAVNNSTDNTKEVSEEAGSKVIEVNHKVKNKAEVLRYCFHKLANKNYDAYLIFDADNVVDKNFLSKMNDCYVAGYRIGQGQRVGKNVFDNWISGSYGIFYMIQNTFYNTVRMKQRGTASINGTGFMVSKSLIDEIGFNTETITEDVEYTGICALNNEKIAYVKEAITYDEYVNEFKASIIQRIRWSAGSVQCMHRYSFDLVKSIKNNITNLDMLLIYCTPFMQILVLTANGINLIFNSEHILLRLVGCFSFSYCTVMLFALFTVIINKENLNKYLPAVLMFPIFMLTWLPICIIVNFKKDVSWHPIVHNRNISIDNIS